MTSYNAENERIKRRYFEWEKEANGKSTQTINNIRVALYLFEKCTSFKYFAQLNKDSIVAFKKELMKKENRKTNKPISKTYLLHTTKHLIDFFKWLSWQNGYKRKIHVPDTAYFNLSDKDIQTAHAPAHKKIPTINQIECVIKNMPAGTEIEKRNRALIAFLVLTGVRVNAAISLKLKHVFVDEGYIEQDPNEVKTKFGKKIVTYFFPVDELFKNIFVDWINFLKTEKHFDYESPLFPKTKLELDQNNQFVCEHLDSEHWQSTTTIREIVENAFETSGFQRYTPHSFRDLLVRLSYDLCKTPAQFKAWSQNLGHNSPLTTFTSYGHIPTYNQGEIIKNLGKNEEDLPITKKELKELLSQKNNT
jgi:integrase